MTKTDSEKSELRRRRETPLITPTDLGAKASADIAGGMNAILADVFALYMKTKNFHWHMSGPHFRDYHHPGSPFARGARRGGRSTGYCDREPH